MGKTGIEITSVTDKMIGLKLPVVVLEDLLNESITLSDYSNGIKKIFIVFIVVPSSNNIHEESFIYTKEEQHLEIAIRLDYDTVLKADSEACMSMMKQFLHNRLISNYDVYSEGFDWRKFTEAIDKL